MRPTALPPLTAVELHKKLQSRPLYKAGGFDGWTTEQARALPLPICELLVDLFTWIEGGVP